MKLARDQVPLLLNALYELDHRSFTVEHPSPEIGELLRIELQDGTASTVSLTTGAMT